MPAEAKPTTSAPPPPLTVEDRLALDSFEHDDEPFITVETALCKTCVDKPCLYVCPAQVYRWENDDLVYNTEGCMELGACGVVCHYIGNGAIQWGYPRGGKGVHYKGS